jgi:branched-chain amino acid transport system substrate-binding protein
MKNALAASGARPSIGLLALATIGLLSTVSSAAYAADPIKIGVIAEAQAIAGASIPQAAQMAADEINAAGGINGRKIRLIVEDSGYDPKRAVLASQKLIEKD